MYGELSRNCVKSPDRAIKVVCNCGSERYYATHDTFNYFNDKIRLIQDMAKQGCLPQKPGHHSHGRDLSPSRARK